MADENPSVDLATENSVAEKPAAKRRTRKTAAGTTAASRRTRNEKNLSPAEQDSAAADSEIEVPRKKAAKTDSKSRSRRAKNSETRDKDEVAASVAQSLAELHAHESAGLTFSAKETVKSSAANVELKMAPMTALLFQAPDVTRAVRARLAAHKEAKQSQAPEDSVPEEANDVLNQQETADLPKKSRRGSRGGKRQDAQDLTKQNQEANQDEQKDEHQQGAGKEELNTENVSSEHGAKRTRKRLHSNVNSEDSANDSGNQNSAQTQEESGTTVRRRRRRSDSSAADEVSAPKGSTRLEAKRQRRKEGREAGRRRHSITESEFLARREAVNRQMLVREHDGLNQIAVIEDSVLVEHYVARHTQTSMVGNVYLGRVQNVLPSMEAAFVDIGKGRNAVLYSGEVNWEAAGLEGKPRKIEDALKSGDTVLVQVTKDPIGHKGARLTGQITLAGRHLVLVPNGTMMGISRKLPETERSRLKKILKQVVPSEHGVIVRTAAEGATEEQIKGDVKRLIKSWKDIDAKSKSSKNAPSLLKGEPELAVRVVRDVFNEDFNSLQVQGENAWNTIWEYVHELSPELEERVTKWEDNRDIFIQYRVDEQLQKAFDRKVFLPSGGSLVIDRTEAMTVIDVNTGKFTGATGGTLEETVTKNNLEAAEEIVRQLRLRDIGGIVVIDFIDMVLEANRDLVLRRLIECLGRDRTRHQVAEVTSLGLVQMTRKRVGQGLVEAFSTTCEACEGRGYISHDHPVEKDEIFDESDSKQLPKRRNENLHPQTFDSEAEEKHAEVKAALANIAAAAAHKHEETHGVNHGAGADETENFRKAAKQNSGAGTDDAAKRPKRQKKRSRKSVHSDSDDANSLLTRQMNSDSGESAEKAVSSAADSADSRVLEAASQTAFTVPEQRESGDQDPESVPKRRRVSSTGTITPASSSAFTIMSFPLSGKSDE